MNTAFGYYPSRTQHGGVEFEWQTIAIAVCIIGAIISFIIALVLDDLQKRAFSACAGVIFLLSTFLFGYWMYSQKRSKKNITSS